MTQANEYDKESNLVVGTAVPMAVATPPGSTAVITVPPGSAPVVTAPPPGAVPGGENLPMWRQAKEGSKCCGCCCDFRRAVIVVAIIFIITNALGVIAAISAATVPNPQIDEYDDDKVEEIWDDAVTRLGIYSGIGMFFAILALVGANKYNVNLVAANVLWMVVAVIINAVTYVGLKEDIDEIEDADDFSIAANVINDIIITALFVYPHVGFIMEVKSGIMTPETYPREEFSCCCTPQRY